MLRSLTLCKIKVKHLILSKYIFPLSFSCTSLSFPLWLPAVITQHSRSPFPLLVFLRCGNIVVETFTVFIAHVCKVRRKEVYFQKHLTSH